MAYHFLVGLPGTEDGQFVVPEGMNVDSLGAVYVADTINPRVKKFIPTPSNQ